MLPGHGAVSGPGSEAADAALPDMLGANEAKGWIDSKSGFPETSQSPPPTAWFGFHQRRLECSPNEEGNHPPF